MTVYFSPSNLDASISHFCLIVLAGISNTMFNRSDKSGHPPYSFFHFLYDRENTSHKNRSFLNLFVRTCASTELLQKLLNCFTYFHLPCWKSAYLVMNSLSKTFHVSHCLQFSSVAQSCPTLCDPMNHSTPGLPVHHHCLSMVLIL